MADLSKKGAHVLRGFSQLNHEDRNELMEIFKNFQGKIDNDYRRELVKESVAKAGVPLGPTGDGSCPCCGK